MDSPPPSYEEATGVVPTTLPPRADEITTAESVTIPNIPQPINRIIQPEIVNSYPLTTPTPQTTILLHREENKKWNKKWSCYVIVLVIISVGILFYFLPNTPYQA